MKKGILFFVLVAMLLMPIYGFAQSAPARNASGVVVSYPETRFANVGAMGLDKTGNPGYLMLTGVAVDSTSYVPKWYIWVDGGGDLCMASGLELENSAQFPEGDWNDTSIDARCTKVGGQS